MTLFPALAVAALIASSAPEPPAAPPAPPPQAAPRLRAGILIGDPVAVSLAVPATDALEIHVDAGLSPSRGEARVLAIDAVLRWPEVFGGSAVTWLGLGARVSSFLLDPELALDPDNATRERELRGGVRLPVGISVPSDDGVAELFLMVAPGLTVAPIRRLTFDGGLGIRLGWP